MSNWLRRIGALAVTTLTAFGLTTGSTAQAATPAHYTGVLPDGASWVADVPGAWNGTVILYSHGFGPLQARDAPDEPTGQALLAAGYALVGSSYSGPSLWALASAPRDQFASLDALVRKIGEPRRTIAWGTSMGGLVSALEAESGDRRLDGALTTCGLVAGALNLNDYQLDGEYALSRLLAPAQPVKLVRYASAEEASAAGAALTKIVTDGQGTAAGRARIALGAALMNTPPWLTGDAPPGPADYAGQEQQQQQALAQFVLGFVVPGRYQIELAAGGNSASNAGVDYRALLSGSPLARQVRALYRTAGLDLDADLAELTRHADVTPDRQAVGTLARTSTATGRLRVPELTIHTTADHLVPVEQENWYAHRVRAAGREPLLRQAYVGAAGHCAFRPSETLAALHALESRIGTGHWPDLRPERLNAAAAALGDPGRYLRYTPAPLTGSFDRR
ncbi:alpha/beta hydrolase family protein [Amycolatopsis sp. CA-126428]|uniref:alpha/beta hydrolase family protein n=1 Tax=Amycolatopsis sp. CA-126428 TaxID=2073158 RepID=UPI000CD180B3|nr:alpha/beta hydrolase [Amycolatopsis sp. CA-126428]